MFSEAVRSDDVAVSSIVRRDCWRTELTMQHCCCAVSQWFSLGEEYPDAEVDLWRARCCGPACERGDHAIIPTIFGFFGCGIRPEVLLSCLVTFGAQRSQFLYFVVLR